MARHTPPPPTKFSTGNPAQPKMGAAGMRTQVAPPPTRFGPGGAAGQNAAQRKPGAGAGMLAAPHMVAGRAPVAPPPTQFGAGGSAQKKASQGYNLVVGAAGVRVNVPAGQPRAFYNAIGRGGTVQGRFQSAVLQMKGNSFALPNSFRLPAGPGKPLPEAVRSKMENFYNTDFSGVRVHVGPEAPAIGALAFTVGDTIVFAPGQYDPVSTRGQQILGHELAHVVQQRAGRVHNPYGSSLAVVQDNALEAEADRLGQRAAMINILSQTKHALKNKSNPYKNIQRSKGRNNSTKAPIKTPHKDCIKSSDLDTKLTNYLKVSDLNTKLTGYLTKKDLDTILTDDFFKQKINENKQTIIGIMEEEQQKSLSYKIMDALTDIIPDVTNVVLGGLIAHYSIPNNSENQDKITRMSYGVTGLSAFNAIKKFCYHTGITERVSKFISRKKDDTRDIQETGHTEPYDMA